MSEREQFALDLHKHATNPQDVERILFHAFSLTEEHQNELFTLWSDLAHDERQLYVDRTIATIERIALALDAEAIQILVSETLDAIDELRLADLRSELQIQKGLIPETE